VIGPFDLSGSLGHLGEITHPDVVEAIARVERAGRERGVPVGIFAASAELAREYLARGFTPVAVGVDAMLLAAAARGLRQSVPS